MASDANSSNLTNIVQNKINENVRFSIYDLRHL